MTAGKIGNNDAHQPAPLSELDKALKGIVGTEKAEVDADAEKEQRRKARSKGKKPKPQDDG